MPKVHVCIAFSAMSVDETNDVDLFLIMSLSEILCNYHSDKNWNVIFNHYSVLFHNNSFRISESFQKKEKKTYFTVQFLHGL